MTQQEEVRCNCRKHAVTGLRCTRCNAPICPDCSKPAPVGFFCRDCAANRKSPLYQISAGRLFAAGSAGLVTAIVAGWILSSAGFGIGFYGLIVGFFVGTGIGEIMLRVASRKRGIKMEVLAVAVTVTGLILGRVIATMGHPAAYMNPAMDIVMLGVCAFGALNRVRFL